MARETSVDAPSDPEPSLAEQGRAALARHAWGEALEKLTEADAAAICPRATSTRTQRHDETVRSVVAEHGGEVVKHTGDGFFLAFGDPSRAIEAMVALQRRLAAHASS